MASLSCLQDPTCTCGGTGCPGSYRVNLGGVTWTTSELMSVADRFTNAMEKASETIKRLAKQLAAIKGREEPERDPDPPAYPRRPRSTPRPRSAPVVNTAVRRINTRHLSQRFD